MNPFNTIRWRILATAVRNVPGRCGGKHPKRRKPEEGGWRATVNRVIADLEGLNRATERDFLEVGGKLMEFSAAARRISSDMAVLTELISGERAHEVSRALARMMQRAQAMGARIEQSQQALARVHGLSRRVQFAFLKVQDMVSVIRSLCTLTRIETSLLGSEGTGFSDLADEVNPLSQRIQASGEGVLDAAARLDRSIHSALRSGSELSAVQLRELHSLIATLVETVQSFEERRERAQAASGQQAEQHAAICGAIDDLVGSIQFHDITRQQIEHVCQALQSIGAEKGADARENCEAAAGARTGLTLQASQLSSAGQAFAGSMQRMQSDLESIAARSGEMAEASRTLMGLTGDEKNSFFLRMENLFTGILRAVTACTGADSGLRATASILDDNIAPMRKSVQEIRDIEIHIQRIAINASIRAAHIGAAGNGLNVIADVLHGVALDSNTNTEEVASALDSMGTAAREVAGGSSGAISSAEPDTEDELKQIRIAILELHSSSESSFSRVNQISELSAQLRDEIRLVLGGMTAGPLFAEVVARAMSELQRIGAYTETQSAAPHLTGEEMQSFAERYTMHTEREVHRLVLNGGMQIPEEVPVCALGVDNNAPEAVKEDALGENVELF